MPGFTASRRWSSSEYAATSSGSAGRGSDQAHLPQHHVRELRQLVHGVLPEPATEPRDPRVAAHLEQHAVAVVLEWGVVHRCGRHRPELEDGEDPTVLTDPGLTVDRRPRRPATDRDGQQQQKRQQQPPGRAAARHAAGPARPAARRVPTWWRSGRGPVAVRRRRRSRGASARLRADRSRRSTVGALPPAATAADAARPDPAASQARPRRPPHRSPGRTPARPEVAPRSRAGALVAASDWRQTDTTWRADPCPRASTRCLRSTASPTTSTRPGRDGLIRTTTRAADESVVAARAAAKAWVVVKDTPGVMDKAQPASANMDPARMTLTRPWVREPTTGTSAALVSTRQALQQPSSRRTTGISAVDHVTVAVAASAVAKSRSQRSNDWARWRRSSRRAATPAWW